MELRSHFFVPFWWYPFEPRWTCAALEGGGNWWRIHPNQSQRPSTRMTISRLNCQHWASKSWKPMLSGWDLSLWRCKLLWCLLQHRPKLPWATENNQNCFWFYHTEKCNFSFRHQPSLSLLELPHLLEFTIALGQTTGKGHCQVWTKPANLSKWLF